MNPLRGITGDAHFNEVFFDDVFVPDADVVGDVNKGWLVARATLGNERISIGGGSARRPPGSPPPIWSPCWMRASPAVAPGYVHQAGRVIAESLTLPMLNLRRVSRAIAGAEPGPEGNVTKLLVAEHSQRLTELGMALAGAAGGHRRQRRADARLSGQPRHDDRRRHLGDHPQHHRRADPGAAARSAAQVAAIRRKSGGHRTGLPIP